jgi:succinyl-CoA synthetase beta subunit
MVAQGVIAAAKEVQLDVPLVVRLEGTNVEEGRRLVAESGLDVLVGEGMADGAEKIVAAVGGAGGQA